jgi:hypothetical protein
VVGVEQWAEIRRLYRVERRAWRRIRQLKPAMTPSRRPNAQRTRSSSAGRCGRPARPFTRTRSPAGTSTEAPRRDS